jgi:thiamine-monophosphate kinase
MSTSTGEFALIDWIRARSKAGAAVPVGIGDDAALVRTASAAGCLVTTDLLMEGVHFDLGETAAPLVGRKALAVNLSDIAAMAGKPTASFISLALPRHGGRSLAEALYEGIFPLAEQFGVTIAGGDTNSWDGPLVISITLLGDPPAGGPVLRSGAQVGDWILVTGALGGSLAGRHLSFVPRVEEALVLHAAAELHSMIDVSDGVASDLRHILRESGVGGIVRGGSVPISDNVDRSLPPETRLLRALTDGEDFELLFTANVESAQQLLDAPPEGVRLSHIGEITEGSTFLLETLSGDVQPMPTGGWQHAFDD